MPESLTPEPATYFSRAVVPELSHGLAPQLSAAETARQNFVKGLRSLVVNGLTEDMHHAFQTRVGPAFKRSHGRSPNNGAEIHKAMRGDPAFSYYSLLRIASQRMKYAAVAPVITRTHAAMKQAAARATDRGSLEIDPTFKAPRNVTAIDVHLMPGSYVREDEPEALTAGAFYDQGLTFYTQFGRNLDDIGCSMAHYIKRNYPDFKPKRILDLGCTVGHNASAWARAFPDAEVHAIDVAAPALRYGHARSNMQGVDVHFKQMDASKLSYADQSFDLVFSSMFLHEISLSTIDKVFKEAHRVLNPGGLMLHMELPPNLEVNPYMQFSLDWDCYYNNEPFYKKFRDQDPRAVCAKAGFDGDSYLQFVVPSIDYFGRTGVDKMLDDEPLSADASKRSVKGPHWFGFGSWR